MAEITCVDGTRNLKCMELLKVSKKALTDPEYDYMVMNWHDGGHKRTSRPLLPRSTTIHTYKLGSHAEYRHG